MIAAAPLPHRVSPAEQPPMLAVDDLVTVRIGPRAYPGVVVGVIDAERVRVSYRDDTFDLTVERSVPVWAVALMEPTA